MKHAIAYLLIFAIVSALAACAKIRNREELDSKDIQQIRNLKLLNLHEEIYQLYSNAPFRKSDAGNFYSTERIANYWLDSNKRKNQVNSAYYHVIAHIDTVYLDRTLTYLSYMTITRKDGSNFRVYAGGKKPAVKAFFEQAIAHWKASACPCK